MSEQSNLRRRRPPSLVSQQRARRRQLWRRLERKLPMFCRDEFAIAVAGNPEYFGQPSADELRDPAVCHRRKSRRMLVDGRYVRIEIQAIAPPAAAVVPRAAPHSDPLIAAVVGDAMPARLTRAIAQSFSIAVAIARRSSRKRLEVEAFVAARCSAPTGRAWCCLSCAQLLANDANLAFHLEYGRHVVAKICELHGAEVEACE